LKLEDSQVSIKGKARYFNAEGIIAAKPRLTGFAEQAQWPLKGAGQNAGDRFGLQRALFAGSWGRILRRVWNAKNLNHRSAGLRFGRWSGVYLPQT